MNQKGYSWPEAILTIAVLLVVFGTLLPSATHIMMHLQKKQFSMYAAETIYQAAIANRAYAEMTGSREIKGIIYDWKVEESSICTAYTLYEKEFVKCVEFSV